MSKFCMCCGKENGFLGRLIPLWSLCEFCNAWDGIEYMRPNRDLYYTFPPLRYTFKDYNRRIK